MGKKFIVQAIETDGVVNINFNNDGFSTIEVIGILAKIKDDIGTHWINAAIAGKQLKYKEDENPGNNQ